MTLLILIRYCIIQSLLLVEVCATVEVDVLVLLPFPEGVVTPAWERGQEILPGAVMAVEHINSNASLLPDVKLGLKEVKIELCKAENFTSNYKAVVPLVNITARTENASRILGLIGGPFCPELLGSIISPLASRRPISLFQLSGSTSETLQSNNKAERRLNFITPSVKLYYKALFSLMLELKWKRLIVLAESFFQGALLVEGSKGLDITFMQLDTNINTVFQELRRSAKNIVFVSTNVHHAIKLLCEASRRKFIYPSYIWIFSDMEADDILKFNTICDRVILERMLQNIIFLNFPFTPLDQDLQLVSGYKYSEYLAEYLSLLHKGEPNTYANVLYDSVWSFALALDRVLSSNNWAAHKILEINEKPNLVKPNLVQAMNDELQNVSFTGASGSIDFNALVVNDVVAIYQYNELMGIYRNSYLNITINKSLFEGTLPKDNLSYHYNLIPVLLATFLSLILIVCLLLTTVIVGLFVYYRKDSEIKATSPNLSYVMFLGCYLLFGATLAHTLTGTIPIRGHIAVNSVCGVVIIGDSIGVNLIFTTLLLRLLRTYRVFSYFGRTSKLWSDKIMILIIVLVIFVDGVLILVWSYVDTFRIIEVVIYHPLSNPPFYEVRQFCHSDHLSVWIGILLGKLGVLFVVVLVLAVKTRKISRSNFKDTKKVNAYIFVTILVVIFPMAMYSLLWSANSVLGTYLTLYFVFGLVALLCQLFLFLPKVLNPSLKRFGYQLAYDQQKQRMTITKQNISTSSVASLIHSSILKTSTSALTNI